MCDRVCDDDDDGPIDPAKLVYRKDEPTFRVERWYVTHVGCGLNEVGPFDSEDEARLFQAIDLAPLATDEQIGLFIRPSVFDHSHHLWLSVGKWYQGKVWYLVRHSRGRIMPEDRYIPALPRLIVPARLDPNGDAKPLTRIVHHVNPDWCQGPGMPLHNPEYESETGERIPLRR